MDKEREQTIHRGNIDPVVVAAICKAGVKIFDPNWPPESKPEPITDPTLKPNYVSSIVYREGNRAHLIGAMIPSIPDQEIPILPYYKDLINRIANSFFGDPSNLKIVNEISSLDRPDKFIELVIKGCQDSQTISNWKLRIGFGGHDEVSPRFPAYISPAIEMANRFQDNNLPVPEIQIFDGVESAVTFNGLDDPKMAQRLRDVREANKLLITEFMSKFHPNLKYSFQSQPEFTPEKIQEIDHRVELLAQVATFDPELRRVIYKLAESGAKHRNADEQHMLNVMRYIVIHVDIFDDIDNLSINIINTTEAKAFAVARAKLSQAMGLNSGRVSDFVLKNVSSQIPTYYLTPGVDYPIGQWQIAYPNGGKEIMETPIPANDPIAKVQTQAAIYDMYVIGRSINPTNPLEGLGQYTCFLRDFEKNHPISQIFT